MYFEIFIFCLGMKGKEKGGKMKVKECPKETVIIETEGAPTVSMNRETVTDIKMAEVLRGRTADMMAGINMEAEVCKQ